MKVNKKEYETLNNALEHWEKEGLLDAAQKQQLSQSLDNSKSDIGGLTYYVFIAAISCAVLAFGALVLDEKWIERMRAYFSFTEWTIGITCSILTIIILILVRKRKIKYPEMSMANESLSIVMLFSTGVAVAYLGRALGFGMEQFSILSLITVLLVAIFSILIQSTTLWMVTLIGASFWFISVTYEYTVHHHTKWLGMNIPLRLTIFAAILWSKSLLYGHISFLKRFKNLTFYSGMILFCVSFWLLSIMGNYNYDDWLAIRQGKVAIWSIVFTLFVILGIWWGVKRKDNLMRDTFLIFFMLNLYTRYFEYFWDKTNKGLFFAIMAVSFWLVGRQMEKFRKKQDEIADNI